MGWNFASNFDLNKSYIETELNEGSNDKYILGPKHFNYQGHNYFFSAHEKLHENETYDWLDARNLCRDYCMDAVNIETQAENDLIFKFIEVNNITELYTSGRLCDFDG